jgi:hypothetical protein
MEVDPLSTAKPGDHLLLGRCPIDPEALERGRFAALRAERAMRLQGNESGKLEPRTLKEHMIGWLPRS